MSGKSTIIGTGLAFLIIGAFLFTLRAFSIEITYRNSPELGDEIVVTLGRFVDSERIKGEFRIIPPVDGEMVWLPDVREIRFLPLEPLAPDATYRVLIGTRSRIRAALLPQDAVLAFTTSRDETPPVLNPSVTASRYIDVNLATMQLTLVEDSRPAAIYPIAAKGSPWTSPTREGTFSLLSKEQNRKPATSNVVMPLLMRYSGQYSINTWPSWEDGILVNSNYSGGGIWMFDFDMQGIYDWSIIGDTFIVHSTPGRTQAFSEDTIGDGDLVSVVGSRDVFLLKEENGQKYKRHVLTESFGDFYPRFRGFWSRVKAVASESALDSYFTSRWVLTEEPRENGAKYIYEISAPGIKQLIECGDEPDAMGQDAVAWKCEESWAKYGWPKEELFVASDAELAIYQDGESIVLPAAPWAN